VIPEEDEDAAEKEGEDVAKKEEEEIVEEKPKKVKSHYLEFGYVKKEEEVKKPLEGFTKGNVKIHFISEDLPYYYKKKK
jgi:hypothetical protein